MMTALVQFKLPAPITRDQAQALFLNAVPQFCDLPGLIRKYFLLSQDGGTTGGVYLWKSREDADRFYSSGFKQWIVEQYGLEPDITYFESPVVVDNVTGETITMG